MSEANFLERFIPLNLYRIAKRSFDSGENWFVVANFPPYMTDAHWPSETPIRLLAEISVRDSATFMPERDQRYTDIPVAQRDTRQLHADLRLPIYTVLNYMLLLNSTEDWQEQRDRLVRGDTSTPLDSGVAMVLFDHCAPWHLAEETT